MSARESGTVGDARRKLARIHEHRAEDVRADAAAQRGPALLADHGRRIASDSVVTQTHAIASGFVSHT